jgi:ketosteroid isomerase-like protein
MRSTTRRGFTAAGLAVLLCAAGAARAHDGEHMTAAETAAREIRQADIDFCAALAARDVGKFKGFVAAKGKFFGGRVNVGPDEVSKAWGPFFDPESKFALLWAPKEVIVSASADLGYSLGEYDSRSPAEDGTIQSKHGYYVTIWRKDPDGRWRVIIDIGTAPGQIDMTKKIFAE